MLPSPMSLKREREMKWVCFFLRERDEMDVFFLKIERERERDMKWVYVFSCVCCMIGFVFIEME